MNNYVILVGKKYFKTFNIINIQINISGVISKYDRNY